jgi:biotin-(acetyl-CoA carboxylase) ligase
VRGKKIAGILIETQSLKNGPKAERHVAAVIGVGVNYDMSALHNSELPAFTDILDEIRAQAVGQQPERTIVAAALLRSIVDVCQNFQENSQQYLEKYRTQYDYCKAKDVEIILDNREVLSGIAQGVNEQAELVVMIDGEKRVFNSAEVSVRAAKGSVTA